MNKKMIFATLGKITVSEAGLMVLPLIVSLIYREWTVALSFLAAITKAYLPHFSVSGYSRGFFTSANVPPTAPIHSNTHKIMVTIFFTAFCLRGYIA